MGKIKRAFYLLLTNALAWVSIASFIQPASAFSSDDIEKHILDVPYSILEQIGSQIPGGYACSCYSQAYARAILDKSYHNWSEYNQNGQSEYDVWCCWGWAGFNIGYKYSQSDLFEAVTAEIDDGSPAIIYVEPEDGSFYQHYVCAYGYKDRGNSADDIYVFDPLFSDTFSEETTLDDLGYQLKWRNGAYKYIYNTTSLRAELVKDMEIDMPDDVIADKITLTIDHDCVSRSGPSYYSDIVNSYSEYDKITAYGFCVSECGNIWYFLGNDEYLYCGHVWDVDIDSSASVAGLDLPASVQYGNYYNIHGKIAINAELAQLDDATIHVTVVSNDTDKVWTNVYDTFTDTYSLSGSYIDHSLTYDEYPRGNYTITVSVKEYRDTGISCEYVTKTIYEGEFDIK